MNRNPTIAVFDLTGRCTLRCTHCYYYAAPPARPDLDDERYLSKLREVQDRHAYRSAFWVGGEPLLRPQLLERAMKLFARNAVATSGSVPIPDDLDAGLLISVDGLRPQHDALRGAGAFDGMLAQVASRAPGSFALSLTLTAINLAAIDSIPELKEITGAVGVLVGFHVGPSGDPLRVDGPARAAAVEHLLAVRRQAPDALLNSAASLALFAPGPQLEAMGEGCIYHGQAVAYDNQLEPKPPCTFGARASCDSCGCPVVALQAARRAGDGDSHLLLRALFPGRALGSSAIHGGPV